MSDDSADGYWTIRREAAEAEWVINHAIIVNLPDLAVEAMEAGWDSPSLRGLAGMGPHDDARDVRATFLSAVTDLGRKLPGRDEAAGHMITLYSSEIAQGRLAPYEGARLIARLGYDFTGEAQDRLVT